MIANDDGFEALGIRKLAEALAEVGDIYISSPHKQQSASGHGITIGRLVYVDDISFPKAKQN